MFRDDFLKSFLLVFRPSTSPSESPPQLFTSSQKVGRRTARRSQPLGLQNGRPNWGREKKIVLHPRSLTYFPWKWMVGRRSYGNSMGISLFFWNLGTLRKAKLGVSNIVPACYSETFNVEKSEPQNSPNNKKSIDLSTGCGSQRLPTIGWWYPFHGLFQVPPTIQPKITTTTWL